MIVKPINWNEVKEPSDRPKLPVGAYVCRVKKVAVQMTDWGEQLCILFDILEGEFKDYFNKEFSDSTLQDKKWKGILRQWLPKNDGSEKDEWTKSSLKGLTTSFEKSNLGYQWNWDEQSLVGKTIGILFRNEEWEYNGKTGWAVRPFIAISADKARSGDFTLPKDKPLKKDSSYSAPVASDSYSNGFTDISADDIPF